jgi:threonine/homoserine efflux transporter RhtA
MMIPVVGVFSGMLVLGETPHWQDHAALLLVVGALATVLLPARGGRASRIPPGEGGGEARPSR